jgi:hypothetical protein
MLERHRLGLQRAIDQSDRDLRSHLQAAGMWFISQPPIHFLSMFHTDMPLLSDANMNRLLDVATQSIFAPIRQTFAQAQERGEIRDARPELLAGFFLSVIESIPLVTTSPNAAPKEVVVKEMISVLLDGLKPQ